MSKSGVSGRRALLVGSGAFFLAALAGAGSQGILNNVNSLIPAFILLLAIVFIGILFDIIGVAATAAKEASLHAKAACKVAGAKQALSLVRNAHNVSSFCNDMVGDVSATLSGAIGAAIVFRLFSSQGDIPLWASILMTAAVSGLTIGGKAWSKGFAITQAEEIIFQVGRLMAGVGRTITSNGLRKGKR